MPSMPTDSTTSATNASTMLNPPERAFMSGPWTVTRVAEGFVLEQVDGRDALEDFGAAGAIHADEALAITVAVGAVGALIADEHDTHGGVAGHVGEAVRLVD